jgi:hypothetical protein
MAGESSGFVSVENTRSKFENDSDVVVLTEVNDALRLSVHSVFRVP